MNELLPNTLGDIKIPNPLIGPYDSNSLLILLSMVS